MPEEQATYHTPQTDMPETTEAPRSEQRTLQIIQDIAEQAIEDGDDLEGALIQIHHEAGHPTPKAHIDFYALAQRTIRWAEDKGIHDSGTPEGQVDKMLEEAIETWAAVRGLPDADIQELQEHVRVIADRDTSMVYYDQDARDADIRDGFGDVLVTLINTAYAHMQSCNGPEGIYVAVWLMLCWRDVLIEIENRSGEMKGGTFVKSEDL